MSVVGGGGLSVFLVGGGMVGAAAVGLAREFWCALCDWLR